MGELGGGARLGGDAGYPDLSAVGAGKADTQPVQMVSWYDIINWFNAEGENRPVA